MNEPRRIVFDELRYIPVVACVLLVTLRLFIGWQFLYEGLWKIDSLDSPQPWTAAGYLKSAQGPFRDHFRGMTGDPDDKNWLDQQWVEAGWDAWSQRFTQHYNLDERQQARLNEMLNGPKDFRAELASLPEGAAIPDKFENTIRFDPGLKRIIVDGKRHLWPSERDDLLNIVQYPESETDQNRAQWELIRDYEKAIQDVYTRATRLSFKERLMVALGPSDPDRTRLVFSNFKGTLGDKAPEKIDTYYQELLAAYNAKLDRVKKSNINFQRDHLAREWEELQELRTELVGPIKSLDAELKTEAQKLLTAEQLAMGPAPQRWDQQRVVDMMTIVALAALGFMLIAGLGTRAAAILGAGMLMSFYLVWPPWPGVIEAPGTEHAFIVNKNLIEVVALLAIAAMPTGQWFGLDRLFTLGWRRIRGFRRTRPISRAGGPDPKDSPVVAART